MKAPEKTIYKVNGRTFYNSADAKNYIEEKNYLPVDRETFEYKGKTVICINVVSK